MDPSSSPDFQRPPITELGIGLVFRRVDALTSAHLGRFWAQISSDFPSAEDHAPVGAGNEWSTSAEGLPLPRLWLIERSGETVVQLQVNRLHLNWRKRDDCTYPGFQAHLGRLLQHWRQFGEFVRDATGETLSIESAEVLKVSQIYEGDVWSGFEKVPTLFPVLNFDGIAGDWGMRGFAVHLALNHGDSPVQVEIKSARPVQDKTKRLLQVEIRVPISGIDATSTDPGNLAEQLTQGNQIANFAFTSVTSEEAQRNVWHRRS